MTRNIKSVDNLQKIRNTSHKRMLILDIPPLNQDNLDSASPLFIPHDIVNNISRDKNYIIAQEIFLNDFRSISYKDYANFLGQKEN